MKKCLRCGRIEEDTAVYCPSCGDSIFERVEDAMPSDDRPAATGGQERTPNNVPQHNAQQPPAYNQPPYQAQQPPYEEPRQQQYRPPQQPQYGPYGGPTPPRYYPLPPVKEDPVTIGDYVIFSLLMLIPVFNLVYLIMVAVGGPRYKPSLTNYARFMLIMMGIGIVLSIIIVTILLINNAALIHYYY